jgi:hypothetical protein
MVKARTYAAVIGVLAMLGGAVAARAEQPLSLAVDQSGDELFSHITAPDLSRWGPQPTHKTFQWDQKHWGLRLDMSEPVGREMELRDIQAGAFFKLTPSLRVGGAVAFADQPTQPDRTSLPTTTTPRVRLETTFKF